MGRYRPGRAIPTRGYPFTGGRLEAAPTPSWAAQFVRASDQFLDRPSTASLEVGSDSYWWALWVYADSDIARTEPTDDRDIIFKGDGDTTEFDFRLFWAQSTDRFRFARDDSLVTRSTIEADELGAPSIDTWYLILVWFDRSEHQIGIRAATQAATFGADVETVSMLDNLTTNNRLVISGRNDAGLTTRHWDGRIDKLGFGRIDGTLATVIGDIYNKWWNSGNGPTLGGISSTERTAWGLESYWEMDEESGTRFDGLGSNNLTDNNGVTREPGV